MAINFSSIFNRVPSLGYLWMAALIFAASNSVTRKLTEVGAGHLIDGRNPISLCNVLFVGNLCALIVMLLIFGKQWNRQTLRQLSRGDWIGLGAIAVLSGALGPGLVFSALDNTSVTSVVLIGRLEPPLGLLLSCLLLRSRVNAWTGMGSIVSFLGVVTTAVWASPDQRLPIMGGLFHIDLGELQATIAALVLAIAGVLTKLRLQRISLVVFNIIRVGLGTIVFYVLARILYGSQHFADVLSPFLWKWMLLYASVIVVAGQLCWFAGLRNSTPAESNLINSLNPLAAIVMAYLILGEVPTISQYIGGAVIFIGIIMSFVGTLRDRKSKITLDHVTPAQQMEMLTGFKGL